MSTDVDVSPGRRHQPRWFAVLAVLVIVGGLVAVLKLAGGGGSSAAGPAPQPAGAPTDLPQVLRQGLSSRLVEALEAKDVNEHEAHSQPLPGQSGAHTASAQPGAHGQPAPDQPPAGRTPPPAGSTLVCAVDPIGVEPPDVYNLAQVVRVYALHLCAVAERDKSWDWSTRYSGPLVATMNVSPIQVDIIQPGEGFPQRVQVVVPDRLQARATGPFLDQPALAELRRRFDAARG
jgi:hypothetical protein